MTHASLFSGIGGPEVAAAMLGWENLFHCEINPFGRKVLDYWFPNSISYEDITKTSFKEWRGKVDVLTGGFPCQPFSYAGKRGGREDDRYLWPEMLRAIDEIRPAWVVGENVAGITTMVEGGVLTDLGGGSTLFDADNEFHGYELEQSFTIERICRDLERLGYSVQPVLIPAAAVGAPHRRDRIFILAFNADADRRDDVRDAGEDEGKGKGQRLQERDEIRIPRKSSELRPEISGAAEKPQRDGCGIGEDGEQGNQRDFGNAGAGNSERICGEEGADFTYPCRRGSGEIPAPIRARVPDGDESFCDGGKRDAAHTSITGLEGKDQPRPDQGGERLRLRRDLAGRDWEGLRPGERWASFPTVSPVHRGNDGLPFNVDGLTISFTSWRTESLKAYGNAIVPQVMYRIFEAIESLTLK